MEFDYDISPIRIVLGAGSSGKLKDELKRLGVSRPFLLSTPGRSEQLEKIANTLNQVAGRFTEAKMHTPKALVERAAEEAKKSGADSLVSIGGGSVVDLSKGVSHRTGLPLIAVPTNYSGAEATSIWGESADGRKLPNKSLDARPKTIIYDVELTLGLPPAAASTSGVNAIAHAVEALWAKARSPITDLHAIEGIRRMTTALPVIKANPEDLSARSDALLGSFLCAEVLNHCGIGVHHKLCHVLGGSFDLPHSEVHTLILPHSVAFNMPALDDSIKQRLADAFQTNPVKALTTLLDKLEVRRSLEEFGMREEDIDRAADLVTSSPTECVIVCDDLKPAGTRARSSAGLSYACCVEPGLATCPAPIEMYTNCITGESRSETRGNRLFSAPLLCVQSCVAMYIDDFTAYLKEPQFSQEFSTSRGPVSYADVGAADGRPVLFCLPSTSSRFIASMAAPLCAKLGLRLIAMDRPGSGKTPRCDIKDRLEISCSSLSGSNELTASALQAAARTSQFVQRSSYHALGGLDLRSEPPGHLSRVLSLTADAFPRLAVDLGRSISPASADTDLSHLERA